jgi:hypothetical protein
MQHLDEGTIHAWLDGALSGEEAARVEEHAAACERCAAAIAEARGLVAGASRILMSLDNVPSSVTPQGRAAPTLSASTRQQPRALWHALHLTPARAAAAAVVFLAVGTTLVLRHKPDANTIQFAASQPAPLAPPAPATPIMPAPAPEQLPAATPQRKSVSAGNRVGARSAQPLKGAVRTSAPAIADSLASDRLTSDVEKRAQPLPAPSAAPSVARAPAADAAKNAETAAAGIAGRAAAPMVARERFGASNGFGLALAGCYVVAGDSIADLPRRIVLDSTPAAVEAMALRSTSSRDNVTNEGRTVSALLDGSLQPLRSWRWSPLPAGGIRLWSAASAVPPIQLTGAPGSEEVRGTTTRDGREVVVVLRRANCPG